jgi:SAM-dependent methyltransferase
MDRGETGAPRLYRELAAWWPLLSAPSEYEEEADLYRARLSEYARRPLSEVLELGSGGGNNASFLKHHFTMTLVDLSKDMLEVSRALNPECEHFAGDMRSVRLGRDFDAVFVHDAIDYMITEDDLAAVFETARAHLRARGIALFVPDYVTATYSPYTDHGGHDGSERSLRYLEWTHELGSDGSSYLVDFAYALREGDDVRVEHDRHRHGVFPRDVWLRLLREQGFDAKAVPYELSDWPSGTMFVALRR